MEHDPGATSSTGGTSGAAALPALAGVCSGIDGLVSKVSGGRVRDLAHDQLAALLVELRRQQARLDSVVLAAAVGEVDARGSHVHEGALTTAAWVRRHARSTPAEAASLDSDAADRAALRRDERRGLTLAPTLDGSLALSGLADDASGAVIATAVDTASPVVPGEGRTPAQRRLDGLVEICQRYLASPDAPRQGGGGHPHVIVTVDAATLAGPAAGGAAGGTDPQTGSPGAVLSWLGHIPGSTARRIACDAELTTVTVGPDGEITDTGTQRRFFTIPQRRAMVARDGDRCIWPWCDRPVSWADGHHLTWSSKGGPTVVANGALPCAAHHTALHEGGWSAHRDPDGRYRVSHRDGRTLGPEPHPPGHARPQPHRRQ